MSIALTSQVRSFKKIMPIVVAAAVLLTVAGYFAIQTSHNTVSAARPGDYGLKEGDRITSYKADGNPDILIVNDNFKKAYSRVFLNPAICLLYGAQYGTGGCFAKGLNDVSTAIREAFPPSCYLTNGNTNDKKVWYLEAVGPDTGVIHHVQVDPSAILTVDADFFLKVFKMNNAEQAMYSVGTPITDVSQLPACTTGQGTGPTPTPSAVGSINVSLAQGNPVATTVTTNAQGVEFLRVHLAGTGVISSITAKRTGPGATADFDNVYWYEGARRLTSGKSLQSSTGEVTFSNLNWSVTGSKDLSLIADLSGTAGNVNAFVVTSVVLANGSVSGLPVQGNNITISGANSGTITMNKVGSIANPQIGALGAQLSEFKLTANTEGASVKRITMLQGGSVSASNFANLKLTSGSNTWPGTIDSQGRIVFDMGSGFAIAKGGEATFNVYGDLTAGAKKDETILFYFEYASDILAIGDMYGYGMAATITDMDTSGEAFQLTAQGGVLTINFVGPTAQNIGTITSDTVLLRFAMTAANNIEIKQTEITICEDATGDGTFDNANNSSGLEDLDDIRVTDEAAGGMGTILGPVDGSSFTTSDTGSCPDSATGAQYQYTDAFTLMTGKTYTFKLTGDLANNSRGGNGFAAGGVIRAILDNYTDDTPSTQVMKYDGTNTAVADADIVPQADINGPNLTMQSAALTLTRSASVNSQTFVRGTQGVTVAGITFKAAQASDLKVTDITLTGYFDEDNSGSYSVGSDGTTSVADRVSTVMLYEIETGNPIAASPTSNQLSNTTGTAVFNNLNWTIPAGQSRTLGVKVNLGTNDLGSSDSNDYITFDINATGDVVALDSGSRTVNAGNADPICATASTCSPILTIANSGTLAIAVSTANTPTDHAVYWGQSGDVAGIWRFTATNEGQFLEKLQFGEDDSGGTQETDLATNARTVYLEYKNKLGNTLTASGTFGATGTVSFGFAGDNRPYVPKDGSMDMTLKIDYKTNSEGATSGKTWDLAFIGDTGSGTDTFKAVGEGSGVVLNGGSTGIVDRDQDTAGTDIINYRVFPEFKVVTPSSTKLSTVDPVLTFTVTAKGLSDSRLFFDNTAAGSGSLKFEVVASGVTLTGSPTFTVRDGVGTVVDAGGTITNATNPTYHASMTIDFTTLDQEITGGTTKTYNVYLDTITDFNTPSAPGVGADYFQLVLRDDVNGLINWVDNSTNTSTDLDTQSTAGYLRFLQMAGYQFTAE